MAVWQKTLYLEVGNSPITVDDLALQLDRALPRDWGGKDHQTWGDLETNDITISWTEETKVIEEIRFRIDLRNIDRPFIDLVLGIATQLKLQLKLIHVELLEPTVENVRKALDESDAKRFVQDPMKFIEGIGDQK